MQITLQNITKGYKYRCHISIEANSLITSIGNIYSKKAAVAIKDTKNHRSTLPNPWTWL